MVSITNEIIPSALDTCIAGEFIISPLVKQYTIITRRSSVSKIAFLTETRYEKGL